MPVAKKITELTALTSAADADLLPLVDVSDTTDSENGTTKKITVANLSDKIETDTGIATHIANLLNPHTVTLQQAFDAGTGITIANNDNQTFTVTQNDTTNNPKAVTITNTGTGNGLFIDQDGNGAALNIDSEGTSASAVLINKAAGGAGRGILLTNEGVGEGIYIDQNGENYGFFMDTAATTFAGMKLYRNVAAVAQGVGQEQRPILLIHEENTTSATGCVFVRDSSTDGVALWLSMEADKIDSDGTNCALRLYSNVAQTGPNSGYLINAAMDNVNAQTGCAFFTTTASPTTPRGCVRITTTGEQRGLYVYTAADTDSYSGIYLDIAGDTNAIYATRNISTANTDLAFFINDHASSTGRVANFRQDGTGTNTVIDTNNTGASLRVLQDVTNKNWTTNAVQIIGTSVVDDAGTYTKTGAMLAITAQVTETSGTITDSCKVLTLTQSHNNASGAVLTISNSGTGTDITAPNFTLTNGVVTATTYNKVTITAPATSATLTIADGKTLTASNTITFTATDGSTLAIGTGGTLGTAAYTATGAYEAAGGIATHAALQTGVHGISIAAGDTLTVNGSITLTGTDAQTYTFPIASDTIACLGTQQTFSQLQTITIADTINDVGLIINQNDTTNNPNALNIVNAGSGYSLYIDANNTTGANPTDASFVLDVTGNLRRGAMFYSNAENTAGSSLVDIVHDNSSASQKTLGIQNDGTGKGIFIDSNANGLSLDIDKDCTVNNTRTWAVAIASDNAGTGTALGCGIDLSSFSVDEPVLKVVADTITTLGTVSGQFAIDIGGTTYYVPYYTTGS